MPNDQAPLGASRLYHFPGTIFHETVADAGGGAGGGAVAGPPVDPGVEAGAGEAVAPAGAEPGAVEPTPTPAPDLTATPEFTQAVDRALDARLQQMFAEAEAAQQQPSAPQAPDPELVYTDPARYQAEHEAYQDARLEAMLEQRLGPVQPVLQHAEQQLASQTTEQWLGDLSGELGEFDHTGAMFVAGAIQAGSGGQVQGQVALRQGAEWIKTHDAAIASKAVEGYKASLAGGQGGVSEPGVPGVGATISDAPKTFDAVVDRWVSRSGV